MLSEDNNKFLIQLYYLLKKELQIADISIPDIEPYSQFKSHFTTLGKSGIQKDIVNFEKNVGQEYSSLHSNLINDSGLNKMINEREHLIHQIEDNIPRSVEERNLMIHFSRSLGQRLGMELPDPIELAEDDDVDDEAMILKNLKNEMDNLKNQSKFRSRRIIELDHLQKMKNSKNTIQISVIINKDIKLEFTSSIKETFDEL